jgi:hypothetical protein
LNWKGGLKDKISEKENILLYLNDLKGFYGQLCKDVPDGLNSLISKLSPWPEKSEVDKLVSDIERGESCENCGTFSMCSVTGKSGTVCDAWSSGENKQGES